MRKQHLPEPRGKIDLGTTPSTGTKIRNYLFPEWGDPTTVAQESSGTSNCYGLTSFPYVNRKSFFDYPSLVQL